MPRDKIILECTECKSRNFFTDKNKRKHPERVERRKYCPRCDTHRVHKESKWSWTVYRSPSPPTG